jgi:hypothetical protein
MQTLPSDEGDRRPTTPAPGTDTATGTDPDARYTGPGYEDVSFGQAVDRDAELAERLTEETGSEAEAEARFGEEAVGAPALDRQDDQDAGRSAENSS